MSLLAILSCLSSLSVLRHADGPIHSRVSQKPVLLMGIYLVAVHRVGTIDRYKYLFVVSDKMKKVNKWKE